MFRKFAFIGFKTETEAQAALKQFNNTFINTSKIQIEVAHDFGDTNKPRSWSKYAKDSSSSVKTDPVPVTKEKDLKKIKKEKKKKKENPVVEELLDNLKDDPKFSEFLEVHQSNSTKALWSNEGGMSVAMDPDSDMEDNSKKKRRDNLDSQSGKEGEQMEQEDENDLKDVQEEDNKIAKQKGLSDLDYLKSKVVTSPKEEKSGNTKPQVKTESENVDEKSSVNSAFMLRLKGLPAKSGEKAVREFFNPIKIARLRIPKSAAKKPMGIAYVGFKTESELEQALRRNKNFIGGNRVFLKKAESEEMLQQDEGKQRPWELKQTDDKGEDIGETGRLFVRNLAYSCTEEDLEDEFKKFGPLTEVNLPVDSLTKKIKGFAFVTYMMPEHAVKAYTQLDGKVFQGRMLHILPGKEKNEDDEQFAEGSSFKKEKQAKQKALASSSHNWNALFLGANAVADVMAERYQTSKGDILDDSLKGSLGVRMALGETQIVQETRDFLTEHGVALDSFSQPNAERSKTVILVKNLPAKTDSSELETVFSPYGTLGRVLIPPSGITGIVEFIAPTEARAAFTKLAYRKFRHVPLYLEWAPMEVFKTQPPEKTSVSLEGTKGEGLQEIKDAKGEPTSKITAPVTNDDDEEEEEEDVGSVLFVKNLNFDTTDDDLKQHFTECKSFKSANVAKKKDLKLPGSYLSMGYGFVEFRSPEGAGEALKVMQGTSLQGYLLELKISNRTTASSQTNLSGKKKQKEKKQRTTKILVRNIPFEAKKHEIMELFKVFGEIKTVRLPKKMGGTGSHRGFGFVDFLTKQDAKRAFEALCQSTHLYGRRLVLEWAAMEEDVDDIRKRTADHFRDEHENKKFTKSNLKQSLEMSVTD
ncbi:probable RNA-binding protein 19 isoform X2 [Dreissena polymorpha]|nr:probable RNA-binding protein 19 isoform X2 [Dreissena polymorpha]